MAGCVHFWRLRAETFIHVGSGRSMSLVDLPFMRETGTGYPFIPGSGVKGALRHAFFPGETHYDSDANRLFGQSADTDGGGAGAVIVNDARLFALPVRSLQHPSLLVTSPHILARFTRDIAIAGHPKASDLRAALDHVTQSLRTGSPSDSSLALHRTHETIVLETMLLQRPQAVGAGPARDMIDALIKALPAMLLDADGAERLVIVHDAMFGYLSRRALHVRMRNRLAPDTKTVMNGSLWSEESLPPDTLMTLLIAARVQNANPCLVSEVAQRLKLLRYYVQIGGNETVGEGLFHFHPLVPEQPQPLPGSAP